MPRQNRAVFLDLNGTLVMPVQVTAPTDYLPISGSIEAVRLLNEAGFRCPVVTVQSRIEKGVYTDAAFRVWFKLLQAQFRIHKAELLGPYVCPHRFHTHCDCHKPKPTLYQRAARDFDIDMASSFVVGDTLDDVRAAHAIGATTCFVRTGWASRYLPDHRDEAQHVGDDILAVARWIVSQSAP